MLRSALISSTRTLPSALSRTLAVTRAASSSSSALGFNASRLFSAASAGGHKSEKGKTASSSSHHSAGEPFISSTKVDKYHSELGAGGEFSLPHPIWNLDRVNVIEQTHVKPKNFVDRFAYLTVMTMRHGFDIVSGYKFFKHDENMWLRRIVFLETVAGVPGMVGAMSRHLASLRKMTKDYGWIHTLLEEAENERMHLVIALAMRKPGVLFRSAVVATQALVMALYTFAYAVSPRYCHRFVGYLEEQATLTYTVLLKQLDQNPKSLPNFTNAPAPEVAKAYYKLPHNATFRDVILCIRADETHHRDVNHTFADIDHKKDINPFEPGH